METQGQCRYLWISQYHECRFSGSHVYALHTVLINYNHICGFREIKTRVRLGCVLTPLAGLDQCRRATLNAAYWVEMAKWTWRSRSVTPIFNTSWENHKMHIWCKLGAFSSNLLKVIMMTSSNGNIFSVTGHFVGNSPVPSEFPTQRPVTWSFDVFFDLRLNKRLSKQSWGWWFETLSCSLWRHRNVMWASQIC